MTTPNYPYGEPNDPQSQGNNLNYGSYSGNYGGTAGETPQINGSAYAGGFENSPLNVGDNKIAKWALGLGIAALITLLAAFGGPLAILSLLSPILAIAGIIVSIIALAKGRKFTGAAKRRGFSITGLTLSIVTLVIIVVSVIAITVLVSNSGILDCFNGENADVTAQQLCVEETLNNSF
ncbi:hypothetical protein SFC07_02720 [Corynebacterium callunae]|uniref:hypothetical protein n=1 Tax=Corynebacterium callunae TaxID=1721 RepID=UPI003981DD8D